VAAGADRSVPLAFARRWRLGPLAVAVALSWLAWLTVPRSAVAIPAADGASSVLWPLVPTVVALAVAPVLGTAYDDLERTAGRPGRVLRGYGLAACAVAAGLAALPGARFDVAVVARNSILLTALAVASTAVLSRTTAWLPVVALPIVTWLLGTDPASRQMASWAVLLAPATSGLGWVVAAALAATACITYAARR
jgi:hypothetical protein